MTRYSTINKPQWAIYYFTKASYSGCRRFSESNHVLSFTDIVYPSVWLFCWGSSHRTDISLLSLFSALIKHHVGFNFFFFYVFRLVLTAQLTSAVQAKKLRRAVRSNLKLATRVFLSIANPRSGVAHLGMFVYQWRFGNWFACKDSSLTLVGTLKSFNTQATVIRKQAAVFLGNPATSFTLLNVHPTHITVSWKLVDEMAYFKWQLHFIIFPITAFGVASSVTRKTQFHYAEAIDVCGHASRWGDLKLGAHHFLFLFFFIHLCTFRGRVISMF